MTIPLKPDIFDTARPLPALAPPIIRFEQVGKSFRARKGQSEVTALKDINLDVPRGAILGVIGRSGAGKSTLIRLVNGLERAEQRPHVSSTATDVTGAERARAARSAPARIGMIFQHFNLLSSRTVFDNVALPLEIAGASRSRDHGAGRRRCSISSVSPTSATAIPPNSPAGRSSASASPGRWRRSRRCCSATRRPRRSIPETTRADPGAAARRSTASSASPSC